MESLPDLTHPLPSLRTIILGTTGQDVRRCEHCAFCAETAGPDQDLSLESVVQLVLLNDEDVLTCRTVWSDRALASARHACARGLNMEEVLLALRGEARRRGLIPSANL